MPAILIICISIRSNMTMWDKFPIGGFLRFTVMSNRVFIRIIGVAAMRTFLLNTIKVMSDLRIRPTENFKLSDGLKRRLKIYGIKAV